VVTAATVAAVTWRAGWSLTLYPQAGEAGGSFRYSTAVAPAPSLGRDPERARAEAARRARAKIRRYAAANRLNRLGTLTYAGDGCHDPALLRRDVGAFFRALRPALGGEPLPYVWVPEWHKRGHGQHVHFAVGRFVQRRLIDQAWGRGFVHIKLLGDLPVGSGALEEARQAARYLAKYVSKDFEMRPRGRLHRYALAHGFAPGFERLHGPTADHVLGQAGVVMGQPPQRVWSSAETADWQGPPAVWASWAS
jgi:hypothetical protein